MSDSNLLLLITIAVFVVMYGVAMGALGGGFLKPQKFLDTLDINAGLIIMSVGMSLVMIAGSIDISIGGITALISMVCAVYLDKGSTPGNTFVSFLIGIGIGLAFGLFQGYLIAYLEIQPFIVTLAGMFFARGMTTIVNSEPFNVVNEGFQKLKSTRIIVPGLGTVNKHGKYIDAYVEIGAVVAILVVILFFVILKWTKFGRAVYALGGNPQSALMLGINVKRTKFFAHVLCGVLAGLGGYMYFMHVGAGSVTNATAYEMDAIAASIIGGTMLTGGVGNIVGTFFGVLTLKVIADIVSSVGFDEAWWTGITKAIMICLFLIIQSILMKVRKNGATAK